MRSRCLWLAPIALLLALAPTCSVSADATALILVTDALPPGHQITGVPVQGQWWNLSCEYAATSAATAYYGNTISQQTLMNDIGFDADPNKGFRGNISGPWGGISDYGIYPAPILAALQKHGFAHSYIFRANADALRQAISKDHPVVVWIVGNFSSPPRTDVDQGNEHYFLVPYEHAVTAIGYSESGMTIMDPAYGADRTVSWQSFTNAWLQLDGMALVVAP